ncbi:MAG: low molecular weight phosphotyrosine protein phosphatase [Verrucomicrobia bacterium]|nr:low molecular weight phosphotyrosine protein phosphatase [Verrucomicrobiota bacterium]
MNRPRKVLVVCKGNICRSPTAEAVLRSKASQLGLALKIDSAGVENYHCGSKPDPRAIKHAHRRGYDLTTLRARQIKESDFIYYDIILAADKSNLADLKNLCPVEHHSKLILYLGLQDLMDPYWGSAEEFEEVLDLIENRADFLLKQWHPGN